MQRLTTADLQVHPIIGLYGEGGTQKSRGIRTASNAVVFSTDEGMSVLRNNNPPIEVCRAEKFADVWDFHKLCLTEFQGTKNFVFIDDVTELAEMHRYEAEQRAREKTGKKADGRQAYWDAAEAVLNVIRAFRVVPGLVVVVIFKETYNTEKMAAWPDIPGKKILNSIPQLFSECWRAEVQSQLDESGNVVGQMPVFRTQKIDGLTAKTRSGLPPVVEANWNFIFQLMYQQR